MSENKGINKIVVHTGNILENEELVRRVGQSTLEELRGCIKTTLNNWKKEKSFSEVLRIRGYEKEEPDESLNGIKTTIKIFLSENKGEHVQNAIATVKEELGKGDLDTVIVIPPDVSDDLPLSELKAVWESLESAVASGEVCNIGIADLSPDLFKELYEWAEVKPSVIQVNLSSCCTISEDLASFAAERDVQVLTHNDDPEVIDEEIIANIMSRAGLAGAECTLNWLARHRVIQTCYGLVASKGYTLSMEAGGN